ncbi:MAG: phage tail protein [Aeromonas sp.]
MAEAVTLLAYRRRLAAQAAAGTQVAKIAYMAFGDGGHDTATNAVKAPNENQTALNHELLRKPLVSVTQEDQLSATGRGLLESGELNGKAISEAALIDSNGDLIGIKNFAPKIKESDERYEISIKMRY